MYFQVSDEILHCKLSMESCYIAAQTMRTKIQSHFHEVPVEAHISLRDSLMGHIEGVDEQTSGAIVTQLSLALADLILLMPEWKGAVNDLIMRLQSKRPWSLLEVLVVLPEEVSSRQLRLGANRRNEVTEELKQSSHFVNEFLKVCVNANPQYKLSAFKCLASWLQIGAISLENIDNNDVMHEAFRSLANVHESPMVHEAAADCVIALLVRLEGHDNANLMNSLEMNVFTVVRKLEEPYHLCVANEDLDKALNLCRVFTELAETFLNKMIIFDGRTPHFAITILDNVLICCGHPDYEIPDITFNFWYRLSEELYQKNDDNLNTMFRPYIERLINSLCRHCQMEPDCSGLLEDGEDFCEFRNRVVELIKDVVFIVGSANVFKHMFAFLSSAANSWETSEAALFIMAAVARNLFPNENENVPPVMESILVGGQNQHMAVRHTSLRLIGELGDWVNHHPEYLERILNWLLMGLQEPRLASQAATSLQNICSQCQRHMTPHFEGLVHILRSLDSFQLKPMAATGLIKGCAMLICNMPHDRYTCP
jgi:transportin-3